jgi:hypothetical protein
MANTIVDWPAHHHRLAPQIPMVRSVRSYAEKKYKRILRVGNHVCCGIHKAIACFTAAKHISPFGHARLQHLAPSVTP